MTQSARRRVAFGWPNNLAYAETVARVVALNTERTAEEVARTVRWLRPDYQHPGAAS